MKNAVIILFFTSLLFSCKKEKDITYTVKVEKDNPLECILEINNETYRFTDSIFQHDIAVGEYDVVDVSAKYPVTSNDVMQLSVLRGDNIIATVEDAEYMWIVFSNSSASTSGDYAGSGSTSTSHLCGYPTQDGTPCKRKVKGSTGYCWQHR